MKLNLIYCKSNQGVIGYNNDNIESPPEKITFIAEIDLLKSHFIFLESRGYLIDPCSNGREGISILESKKIDLVLLDENMPGLNGFETLSIIKQKKPNLPVIMVTKNEEEKIIDDAIGSKVSDYLIKPVNPNQILHSLKKYLTKQV